MTKPHDGRELLYQLTHDGSPVQTVLGGRGTEGVPYGGGGLRSGGSCPTALLGDYHAQVPGTDRTQGRHRYSGRPVRGLLSSVVVEPMIDRIVNVGNSPATKTLQAKHRDPLTLYILAASSRDHSLAPPTVNLA